MNETPRQCWPVKRREIQNRFFDSTIWNSFKFRDDDIIVATYAKSGTTWMQQIVTQLILNGDESINVHVSSPWLDVRGLAPELRDGLEAQSHRRCIKTHLPVDALVFSPKAKYIYIGRDGRDAALSFFNHHYNANEEYFARFNCGANPAWPPFERGTSDPAAFFRRWLERNGEPYWPFWENVKSWWSIRRLPNVLMIHFNDLKSDLPAAISRIVAFLGIAIDPAAFPKIVEYCGFDYMKANAERFAPRGGASWQGGASTFINRGTNGRWREVLSPADIAAYETRAESELGGACAGWLAAGGAVGR